MITVTNRDTCKPAYIDEKLVQHIEEFSDEVCGKSCPYSRVFLKDEKQGHDYFLDVIESKRRIETLMQNPSAEPFPAEPEKKTRKRKTR